MISGFKKLPWGENTNKIKITMGRKIHRKYVLLTFGCDKVESTK